MCHTSRKFFRRLLGKDRERTERPPEADPEAGPALLPVTVPACLPPEPYQHHHQFERSIDQGFELKVKLSDGYIRQAASEDPLLVVTDIVSSIPEVLQDHLYEVAVVTASIDAEGRAIGFLRDLIEDFVSPGIETEGEDRATTTRKFLERCRTNIEHLKTRRRVLEAIKKAVNRAHRRMTVLCLEGVFNTRVEALDHAAEVGYIWRMVGRGAMGEEFRGKSDLLGVLRPRISNRPSDMSRKANNAEENVLETELVLWEFLEEQDVPI